MKIIWGLDRNRLEATAKEQLIAQKRAELRNGAVMPQDVAVHTAKYPNLCDECGITFWAADQWATHAPCPGRRKWKGLVMKEEGEE